MYRKNTASQFVCYQLLLTATGAPATGLSPAVRRCIDGTFAAGGGTSTEDGTTGAYKYAMSQADTNGNDISFIFSVATAIPVCINIITTAADPTDAVHFGLTSLPNTAVTTNGSLLTSGTGTAQISNSSGLVALQAAQKVDVDTIKTNPVVNGGTITFPTTATLASTTNITAGTIATVTTLTNLPAITTNWLTAAGIAAGALNGKGDWSTVTPSNLTAAQIATGVWQDTTAGDFTTALSIGKTIVNGVSLGTGLTINAYTGDTPQSGDAFGRLGVAGVGLTNLGDTRIANLDATVSSRASPTNITAGTITTVTNLTNAATAGDLTATMKTSVTTAATAATPTAAAVTGAVGSVTGNVGGNVTGSVGSVVGAVGSVTGNVGGSVGSVVGAVGSVTGNVGGNVVGSVASVSGNVTGSVGSVAGNVSGSVASVVAGVTVTTNNDKVGYAMTASYDFAKGTTAMTESYAANGVAPSPVQALYGIQQYLMDFAIAGTNYTVKKLDNSTTAYVVGLDSATAPTAASRT